MNTKAKRSMRFKAIMVEENGDGWCYEIKRMDSNKTIIYGWRKGRFDDVKIEVEEMAENMSRRMMR